MSDEYQYSNRVILEDEGAYRKKKFMRFGLFILAIVVLYFTYQHFKTEEMIIYNGFSQDVSVQVGEKSYFIAPERFVKADIKLKDSVLIVSTINGDTVDEFIPSHIEAGEEYIYNVGHSAMFYEVEVIYSDAVYSQFSEQESDSKIIGAPRWFATSADYVLVESPEEIEISGKGHSASKWQLSVLPELTPRNCFGWMFDGAENIKEMLIANATYSSEDDIESVGWITYASYLDPELTVVRNKLKLNPSDVASNRVLMDSGTDIDKLEVCEKIKQLSSNEPNNGDLLYLSCRCIEDDNEQDQAFTRAFKEHPKNGWLGYAAGYLEAKKDNWTKAMDAYNVAMTNEPASAAAALTSIYRVYKHTGKKGFGASNMFDHDEDITYYEALANGNSNEFYDNSDIFYHQLSNREYGAAEETVLEFEDAIYFKLLFDLSKNAPSVFHDEIMNSDAYIDADGDAFFIAAAFSAKYNVDLSRGTDWSYALENYGIDEEAFGNYMAALKSKNLSKIIASLNGITDDFVSILKLKSMARIVLGNGVSEAWKNEIDNMLYVSEKPIF